MPLAYIRFIDERTGRPVDPDYGVDEGYPGAPGHPDQGLPGHPGRPPRPPGGRPIDPGFGWGGGEHPGNRPPGSFPGRPVDPGFGRPGAGGRPVDPGYGVDIEGGGGSAGQLPVWPVDPDHPIAPPSPGHPLPPVNPPPGTIWPPLPPSVPEGKVIALVAISGVGYRYVVLTVPPPKPDQSPGAPDQSLPQPPVATPKR
jgi:hypothetical protein